MRRVTGYYPDTPLSLTHALFQKPHMSGLRPSAAAPEKIVTPPAFPFAAGEGAGYASPKAMGLSKKVPNPLARDHDMGVPNM